MEDGNVGQSQSKTKIISINLHLRLPFLYLLHLFSAALFSGQCNKNEAEDHPLLRVVCAFLQEEGKRKESLILSSLDTISRRTIKSSSQSPALNIFQLLFSLSSS